MEPISVLSVLSFVVGLACVAVGLIYLSTKSTDLPSYFPGHTAHTTHTAHAAKYTKRGILGFAAAPPAPRSDAAS